MADSRTNRFRFRGDWWVAAPPDAVYDVLVTPEDYPRWWPQVREVVRTGPDTGSCRFRSALPFDLRVGITETCRDPGTWTLHIALSGDLDGWLRFSASHRDPGTRVHWEQDTALTKRLLRPLARPLRAAFTANHALMMRGGQRGLRTWLGVHLDDG
ncbi:polyketide cyclase [Streptomyces sp. PT12]|nr:polyketide cyclase [Streptomyces sp. PT12]